MANATPRTVARASFTTGAVRRDPEDPLQLDDLDAPLAIRGFCLEYMATCLRSGLVTIDDAFAMGEPFIATNGGVPREISRQVRRLGWLLGLSADDIKAELRRNLDKKPTVEP